MASRKESRRFIRHSVNVPIEVGVIASSPRVAQSGVNISYGGLSFVVDEPLTPGDIIEICIPTVQPPFDARARVVYCRVEGDRYCVGAAFLAENDAFQARMVEQVCEIEAYRQAAQQEGRTLTTQQAAAEWIQKFAGRFPGET